MTSVTTHIKDRLVEKTTLAILTCCTGIGLILSLADYIAVGVAIFALPAVLLLVSSVRLSAWLFIFSIFILKLLSHSPPLLIPDVMALILLGAFVVDFLLNGQTEIKVPSIGKYFLALFITIIVLSIFSYNYTYAVTSLLRIAVQFVIIIILYNAFNTREAERLIKIFFWVAVVFSVHNLFYFFAEGGRDRIFGYAGAYFDDLSMLAWPVGLAYFLWLKSRRSSFIYGLGMVLVLLGLLATQSRAALLTVIWVTPLILFYSWYKARKTSQKFVTTRLTFSLITAIVFGVGFTMMDFLGGTIARFQELPEISSGTVWLRMSLWKTSLHAFLENPITGVGPGTFRFVETIFPILRFDAARLYLDQPSAHNLLLHYLAETGLTGTVVLLTLFFKNMKTSLKLARFSIEGKHAAISVGLLGAGLTIFGSIFYMDGWMWGQNAHAAPLFIAVTARLFYDKYQQSRN